MKYILFVIVTLTLTAVVSQCYLDILEIQNADLKTELIKHECRRLENIIHDKSMSVTNH